MPKPTTVVTIGPGHADFHGADSAALQSAADEVLRRAPGGGGVLHISGGPYTLHDSLHIRGPMTVRGDGPATILRKCPHANSPLRGDFDLSETIAHFADASGFRAGMGVSFFDAREDGGWGVSVRTIVAVEGNDVILDRRPERDYSVGRQARAQNSFALISAINVQDVVIEDLAVDGNLAQNGAAFLDGCRGGGIYLRDAQHCIIRRCTARDLNGDGISWQTTQDILVEDCESTGNSNYGLHPGTGSPGTIVRRCHAHHNGTIGLFLCWGVRHGLFENNRLEDNGATGISIGHKDTDNLFTGNIVRRNGRQGVLFRDEIESNAGHRCTLRSNTIQDNGAIERGGYGVLILGATRDTVLEGNTIGDTRNAGQRTQNFAIEAGQKVGAVIVADSNRVIGSINLPAGTARK